jgi:DNA-binding Lrp family transcriptional regulator
MTTGAISKKIKLDRIDRKILCDLQDNGRMTNVELADRAGISAPPCLRRVRALEDHNLILGYHADLNKSKLGYGVETFTTVKLKDQSDSDLRSFEAKIMDCDQVREIFRISGDYDYMLRIVATDWEGYQAFLNDNLTMIENIASIKTALTVKPIKSKPGIPIDLN